MRHSLVSSVALLLTPWLFLAHESHSKQLSAWPQDLLPMVRALQKAGYQVRFENPPVKGAYGATNPRKKLIWVAPIAVELGIGRQTLFHEAVHAAQGCPSGKLQTVGWKSQMVNAVDREVAGILYRNYAHAKFDVEREAFAMQGHPQAFELISVALEKRCR